MQQDRGNYPVKKNNRFRFPILLLTFAVILFVDYQLSIAQSTGDRSTTRVLAADSLVAPWINSSWGAMVDFTNTEQVYSGTSAIKATLDAWGGLRLHSGSWNYPIGQDLSPYDTLSLHLRLASPEPVRVGLTNDDPSVSFTPVALENLPVDQWVHVELSMAELGGTGKSVDYIRVGNYSDTTRTLWVDNWELSGSGGLPEKGIVWEGLQDPWISSSWSGSFDFTNNERAYEGASSVKAEMNGWGGLRVHAGTWEYPEHPEISPYDSLRFHVWPDSAGPILVGFSSEAGGNFPTVTLNSLPAGQWNQVVLPLDQLSPNGDRPDQIRIVNYISEPRTLWVDNWGLSRPSGDTASTHYPMISIDYPQDNFETDSSSVHITGTVADTTGSVSLRINDEPVSLSQNGEFSHNMLLFPGDNYFSLKAVNGNGNEATLSRKVVRDYVTTIPPDPVAVAPELDSTVVTTMNASTKFLYKGANRVQYGVEEGTIEPRRAGVVKGKVLDASGSPLPGVLITVKEHPEYGYTLSRNDGEFDLAVNGGRNLTLNYKKDNFLPIQRQVKVPWQDYARIDSVVMLQLDQNVTTIDFSDSTEVARGSVMSDADGSRQATLMFEQGTVATMVLPDGSTQSLNSLDVRATEYTVGDNGPAAMPAILPPTSAYTYCVELSVDEAGQAGAEEVQFDKPVAVYVENFIGFPVGSAVPTGYYDRQKGEWIALENGLVIEVTGISNGMADIDINGDGTADPADSLAALGIDSNERQKVASLYTAGESLWRTEIMHFTPIDHNWPPTLSADAEPPRVEQKEVSLDENDKSDKECGSVISVENRTLGEAMDITGAPCGLHYNSTLTSGFKGKYILPVTLSDNEIPASLKRIELNIRVTGTTFDTSFTPQPNLSYDFQWNGKDAYGRFVQGAKVADINIGYVYDAFFNTPANFSRSFANSGQSPVIGSRQSTEVTLWQDWSTRIGGIVRADFGGWHPGIHHLYDFNSGILYEGNGTIRPAETNGNIVQIIVGENELGGDFWQEGVAVGADGSVYVSVDADSSEKIIRKRPDGSVETVVESPDDCIGDECIWFGDFDVTRKGVIYFPDYYNNRIYKINEFGKLEHIAGKANSRGGYSGDGGPAVLAELDLPTDVAVAEDGAVYVADSFNGVIRKIGTDGIIRTIAGTGEYVQDGDIGDGGPATEAKFAWARGLDIGPEGSLFIADADQGRIRRITPDGVITTVAGSESYTGRDYGVEFFDDRGDGGPATEAILLQPYDVAVGQDGGLYIAEHDAHHIRKVNPDGLIYRLAGLYGENPAGSSSGDDDGGFNFNNGPAPATRLSRPHAIAAGPDDNIYFTEEGNPDVRMIETGSDYFEGGENAIASTDGSRVYIFDFELKHIRTDEALTGNTLFEFSYDSTGLLSAITDIDGLVTSIERDSSGTPTAFAAPFGQRTELAMGEDGYLSSITNPEGETHRFTYTEGGLLTGVTDPRGNLSSYAYDSLGYFVRADYPNGGLTQLAKTETEDGFMVTMTSAEGRTETYQVEEQVDGTRSYITTDAHGLQTVRSHGADGTVTVTAPDSTTTFTKQKPDPRFGMQAPITDTLRVTTPSGLISVFSQTRTITQMTGEEVTGITDSLITNGKVTVSEYDGNQRLSTTTSPEGRQAFTYTDSLGRVIQTSVPGIAPVNYSYDANGFLTETEQGGRTTTYTYNRQGWLQSVTDPLGRVETTAYDSVGRVTKQILPNGEEIGYEYDANGNLASITPPGQPAHTFAYTEVDLTDSYTPPAVPDSAGGINYLYDRDKKLLSTVFSDSSSIRMVYDTTFAGSSRPIAINYDQGSTSFTYDSTTGQLTTITSADSVVTSYSYDGSLKTQQSWSGPVSGTIDFAYDNDFRLTTQSINGVDTLGFSYSDDGLITNAGQLSMAYDSQNGLLTADTLGSITGSYAYNSFGELAGKTSNYNGSTLYNRSFTRDSLGRITSITEIIEGDTTLYEYGYNAIGYLVEVNEDGVTTAQYQYDANGNRTAYITPTDTVAATYDDQDRMLTYGEASYVYGKRGDLQKKIAGTDTTTYDYDNLGNLRSVVLPDGRLIEYVIDGKGRRVAKKVNGAVTKRWLYAGGLMPIAELDSTGSVEKRYGPGYIVKNDTTYRVVRDHLGSVRIVVNAQTGEVVQRIDYDAYGNITHLQNQQEFTNIGFAGGLYDKHTGLIRFGVRDYNPITGRWTSKDPILFAGGTSNLYEYALNDPVNRIDLNGLQSLQISVGVGGSLGLLGVAQGEINFGVSIDLSDLSNTKFFTSTQTSGMLGVAGQAFVNAQFSVGITPNQLETGKTSQLISRTEGNVGAAGIAGGAINIPLKTAGECTPQNFFGIKGIDGINFSGGFKGGFGVAGFGGTGLGITKYNTSRSIRDLFY